MNFFPATDLNLHPHALSEEDPNGVPFPHETAKVEDGFHLLDGFTVSYSLSRTDIPLERVIMTFLVLSRVVVDVMTLMISRLCWTEARVGWRFDE